MAGIHKTVSMCVTKSEMHIRTKNYSVLSFFMESGDAIASGVTFYINITKLFDTFF